MRINREKLADRLVGGAITQLREDVAALDESFTHARESLLELEAERRASAGLWSDSGASGSTRQTNDFSRQFIRTIARDSRLASLKNPLIRRGVDVSAAYAFAQGVTVSCDDEQANKVIQAFWDEPGNRKALTNVTSLFIKEVERKTQGNIFLAFFGGIDTVQVRAIPADQIEDIITDPEDASRARYYKRVWSAETVDYVTGVKWSENRTEYYPALNYRDEALQTIGGHPINWDAPVYHIKSGVLSDMMFGLADTYPAHDWSRSYTEFLEDRAAVAASLSVYAWIYKAKAGVSRALQSIGSAAGTGVRRALVGSRSAAGQVGGVQGDGSLEPVKSAGSTINPEEGRRYLLMCCAALGIPETFLGDVSVGSLATAESLDWPTVLTFTLVQAMWTEVFTAIASYVLDQAGFDAKSAAIKVDWPPIVKQNTKDTVAAIVAAAPHFPGLEGKRFIARKLAGALGENKIDELLNSLDFTVPEPQPLPVPPTGGPQP